MARIIIVEDEAIVCMELKAILNNMGHEVVATTDIGEEAIGKADSYRPDLILMDIKLKGILDGIETAEIIRLRFDIPIVFLTAYMDDDKLERAKLAMPLGLLLKPIRERDLRVTLKLALYASTVDTKRRMAEEKLKQSQQKYHDLVLCSSDWVWEVDHNSRYTYASTKIEDLLGYRPGEILGKTPFDLMPPDEADRVFKAFQEIAAQKKPIVDLENWNLTKTGKKICLQTNASPILDNKGNLIGYRGLDKNVTERKQSEEALKESEERHRLLFENAGVGIGYYDTEGRIISFNRTAAHELNGNPEDFTGKTLFDLFDAKNASLYHERIKKTVYSDIESTYEDYVQLPSGKKWFLATYNRVTNAEKKTIGVQIIANDITEQKSAEEKIKSSLNEKKESERKYLDLYDNAPDMYASVDVKTACIIECNQTLADSTGYRKEEIIGRSIFDMYTPESSAYARNHVFPTFVRTGKIEGIELKIKRKDGSEIDVSLNVSAVRDDQGNILFSRSSWRDISEKKQIEKKRLELEQQLFQAQKMESLGTLAGGIAHDFNNLLFQILGYTQLAIKKLEGNEEVIKLLEPVEETTHRASALVKQILTYSRGTISEYKPIAIQPIIKETLKLLRSSLPTTIEIKQEVDNHCGSILTDFIKIYQVVMNLCTNAYHAMRNSGGTLTVSLGEIKVDAENRAVFPDLNPGAYLELTVSDTGHGMDKKTMNKIFDPLFTTKSGHEGTGLGLSIVKKIVDEHQGIISVSSKPGKGSTFKVFLPRTDIILTSKIDQISKEQLSGQERILVVDDEHSVMVMEREILKELGYKVSGFDASTDALKAFRSCPHEYDLVITDQTMPKMTGAELAEHLLTVRPDIPIILITGYSEIISEEQAINIGIEKYLLKPLDITKLVGSMREVLDQKKPSQSKMEY
ncbi:PAS domain S-box protein [bacterium]|nr:PAS domain S-box protein [bacterium]